MLPLEVNLHNHQQIQRLLRRQLQPLSQPARQSSLALAPTGPSSSPREQARQRHALQLAEPHGTATFDPAASALLLSADPTTHSTNCPSSAAPDTTLPLEGCVASTIHQASEPAWRHCHSTPPTTVPTVHMLTTLAKTAHVFITRCTRGNKHFNQCRSCGK